MDHKFLDGVRVADADEQAEDMREALENALKAEEEKKFAENEMKRQNFLKLRLAIVDGVDKLKAMAAQLEATTDGEKTPVTIRDNFNAKKKALMDLVADSKATRNPTKLTLNAVKGHWEPFAILANFEEGKLSYAYQLIDTAKRMEVLYDEMHKALNYLAAEPDFSPELYAELEEMLSDDLADYLVSVDEIQHEVDTEVQAVFNAVYNGVWRSNNDKNKFYAQDNRFNVNAYQYIPSSDSIMDIINNSGNNSMADTNITVSTTNRYEVTPYTIVYEKYDNGTAFLMNFNDYRVIVELDNKTYTLEAYGYIVLSRAA